MSGRVTDGYVAELHALWKRLLDNYDIDVPHLLVLAGQLRDSLPDCPTCNGIRSVQVGATLADFDLCPDCVDGKVSIEQLAATWRAVWDDALNVHTRSTLAGLVAHLRAVTP